MAFVNDATIARYRHELASHKQKASDAMTRARHAAREKAEELKEIGEAAGAAALVGYARGKFEEADGSWQLMGFDMELVIGLGLITPSLLGVKGLGLPNDDLKNAGIGVLSHFTGQIARKYAKTGNLSFVAGDEVGCEPFQLPANRTVSGSNSALRRALSEL